jgi:hypothetical protein
MYIQYSGFDLATDSRTYTFQVIDPPEETREFTVNVQSEAFRLPPFKIQDGPGICLARLKHELEQETLGSPVEVHLQVGQSDIREYIERTYPKPLKKWGVGSSS